MLNMKDATKEYIFTFMQSSPYRNKYVSLEADSPSDALAEMRQKYGSDWAMHYSPPNARADAGVDEFGLKELKR